jgi:hypothetical protein
MLIILYYCFVSHLKEPIFKGRGGGAGGGKMAEEVPIYFIPELFIALVSSL